MRALASAPVALSIAASPLLALFLACGGGAPAASGAKTAENTVSAPTDGDSGAPGPAAVPSSTTTTTMTLGDGGDLQGAKLGSTTTTTQSATMSGSSGGTGDGGAPGPHASEPGRSVKDIQTIILARRDEARACYDKALKDHPGIEGNIDVKWTIDPKGTVTDIAVDEGKSEIHEPSVGKCISDIIKSIHFSVSGKGFETRAHYPFNFHPRNGTPKP